LRERDFYLGVPVEAICFRRFLACIAGSYTQGFFQPFGDICIREPVAQGAVD
jgi:hypothetical protein